MVFKAVSFQSDFVFSVASAAKARSLQGLNAALEAPLFHDSPDRCCRR